MRIIAGSARGRRLLSVPKKMTQVRPISARIRQSLFDILRPKIPASRFLDLFAGSGTVGLEALSRGAERVAFVDVDQRCLKVIEKNLERTGWTARGAVLRGNAGGALSWIPYRAGVERFDLIFMGPPYKDQEKRPLYFGRPLLDNVRQAALLEPDGWVILQHHQKEEPGPVAGWELFRRSRYGDSRLSFYRFAPAKAPEAGSEGGK